MKKLMVLIVLVFLLGTTVGCGNGVEQNTGVIEEVTESRGIVDDYSDKLTLFDKNIKVPTTLRELGEGYELGKVKVEYVNNDGYQCVQTSLYKDGVKVLYVDFIDSTEKDINSDSIIYSIMSRSSGDILRLDSIQLELDKEDVKKKLGEPSQTYMGDFGFEEWKYFNANGKSEFEELNICVNKGKVSRIMVTRYPEKYR